MIQHMTKQITAQATEAKCVVVVYESPAIREHAVRFCERLAEEEKSATLEMNWWSFHLLGHPEFGSDAVQKAAKADVVVFAMNSGGDLPEEIKLWMERWLNQRGEREGALAQFRSARASGTDTIDPALLDLKINELAHP